MNKEKAKEKLKKLSHSELEWLTNECNKLLKQRGTFVSNKTHSPSYQATSLARHFDNVAAKHGIY